VRLGFGGQKDAALLSFIETLNKDVWGAVDVAPWVDEEGRFSRPLLETPSLVVLKVLLLQTILLLARACAASNDVEGVERTWDSKQKIFVAKLTLAEAEGPLAKQEAAERVRDAMTEGGGLAQTKFTFNAEVDHGRKQALLAAEPNLNTDLGILELHGMIEEIRVATENLAVVLGRESEAGRPVAPYRQVQDAHALCANAFNSVYAVLKGLLAISGTEENSTQLGALLRPLQDLLDRTPPGTPPSDPPPSGSEG
jgi:hypothetical protein